MTVERLARTVYEKKSLKHSDKRFKANKPTPIVFDVEHVAKTLLKRGIDPFDALTMLISEHRIDDDLRLQINVLQYLADHVKAKPKQVEVNGTIKLGLAEILAGFGTGAD